jgi:hypothetical protein
MTVDSLVARLDRLTLARRSAHEYYSTLLEDDDEILKVGGWCALLERQELHFSQYQLLVPLSRYAAIRSRAFVFLQSRWEHGVAADVVNAELTGASEDEAEKMLARAMLEGTPELFVAAKRMQYLATGQDEALYAVLKSVERGTPVELALPYAVRGSLIRPHDARMVDAMLILLKRAGTRTSLRAALGHLDAASLHGGLTAMARSQLR